VEEITDSDDGLSYLLTVKLFADFGRLNNVRVISEEGHLELLELENKLEGGAK
jgi:rod shape-determining protein MreC